MSDRPLLSLHGIFFNESRSVERIVASVLPYIDRYDLLDTGSSDGTPELFEAAFAKAGVPGKVYREPFIAYEDTGVIDFGATRNRALELAAPHARFSLWLSGDETLHGGEALRAFCESERDVVTHGAYPVEVRSGISFDQTRLVRLRSDWRWHGPIHEYMHGTASEVGPRPAGCHVLHAGFDHVRKHGRFARDLVVLGRMRSNDKTDPRAAFYYAQTLSCLGLHHEAAKAYADRAAMAGWIEETYEATYQCAREMSAACLPWPEILARFLDAHALAPHRAEPLFEIACYYAGKDAHGPAATFAAAAAALPLPTWGLFVQPDVYVHRALAMLSWHGYYVPTLRAKGEEATRRLIEMFPREPLHARNLRFYTGVPDPVVEAVSDIK